VFNHKPTIDITRVKNKTISVTRSATPSNALNSPKENALNSHSSSARAAAPASPLVGAHPPHASIRHVQRPERRGSGLDSLLVCGNRLPPRSPPPSTGSPTSSSQRWWRMLEMEDLPHGVCVELIRRSLHGQLLPDRRLVSATSASGPTPHSAKLGPRSRFVSPFIHFSNIPI
jgi:hypothetical protein